MIFICGACCGITIDIYSVDLKIGLYIYIYNIYTYIYIYIVYLYDMYILHDITLSIFFSITYIRVNM